MDIVKLITEILIPIIGAIILYVVIPFIKAKTTVEQRKLASDIVRSLVLATEQMDEIGLIEIPKKDHVLDKASKNKYIKDMNFTKEDLEEMLEAAVKEMNYFK